jgi:hypothetical protein
MVPFGQIKACGELHLFPIFLSSQLPSFPLYLLAAGGKRISQKLAFLLNRFDKKGRKW